MTLRFSQPPQAYLKKSEQGSTVVSIFWMSRAAERQREDEIKQRMCFLSRLEREKRRHVVSSPHEHVNWPDAPFSDLSYCQFEME